jgi:fatty acid-binding protein DegV
MSIQVVNDSSCALLLEGETWLEQVTSVLGAHIGPGMVGFLGISKA